MVCWTCCSGSSCGRSGTNLATCISLISTPMSGPMSQYIFTASNSTSRSLTNCNSSSLSYHVKPAAPTRASAKAQKDSLRARGAAFGLRNANKMPSDCGLNVSLTIWEIFGTLKSGGVGSLRGGGTGLLKGGGSLPTGFWRRRALVENCLGTLFWLRCGAFVNRARGTLLRKLARRESSAN